MSEHGTIAERLRGYGAHSRQTPDPHKLALQAANFIEALEKIILMKQAQCDIARRARDEAIAELSKTASTG